MEGEGEERERREANLGEGENGKGRGEERLGGGNECVCGGCKKRDSLSMIIYLFMSQQQRCPRY